MTTIAPTRSSHNLLSPANEAMVRSTAEVVARHADEITARFYPRMFAERPELLRVFNLANQATGARLI